MYIFLCIVFTISIWAGSLYKHINILMYNSTRLIYLEKVILAKLCLRNAILIALFYVLNHDATRSVIDICGHLRVNTQNAFLIVTLTIHDDSWRFAQYNFFSFSDAWKLLCSFFLPLHIYLTTRSLVCSFKDNLVKLSFDKPWDIFNIRIAYNVNHYFIIIINM